MDLSTEYLGLKLRNPLIIGASPLCDDLNTALRLQDAGAGAVVMRSLFEEQIGALSAPVLDPNEPAGALGYPLSPDDYLRQLARLREQLAIPIIASLNGHQPGHWTDFGRQLEDAGANAIELNFYQVVTDPGVAADAVEVAMLRTVGDLAGTVSIPVSVKVSPFHTALVQLATALELEGSDGLVIFNRFFQPDIDADEVTVRPHLRLSEPGELLMRLRWLAILSPQLRGSLAATGGVHTSEDVVKALLAGADAIEIVSVVLKHGAHVISLLLRGIQSWMREHGHRRIDDFRGSLDLSRCKNPAALERANYVRTLQSWHH
jgi:dihydroorotate dehydrogenase (fumarate)